jgi:phage I-like protein
MTAFACRKTDSGLERITCEIASAVPAPSRILLCPWGKVESSAGNFTVDQESAKAIADEIARKMVDVPIDYEHQTQGGQFSSPDGKAPAAGWIKRIEAVPGQGIFGIVSWTPAGGQAVSNREYRYLSPVVLVRKADGKAVQLVSVGLTNTPAIVGISPIVNSRRNGSMDAVSAADQAAAIKRFGEEWDSEPMLQKLCNRAAYIDSELITLANKATADKSRSSSASTPSATFANRDAAIKSFADEWEREPFLQNLHSNKAGYVSGQLIAHKMRPLGVDESAELVPLVNSDRGRSTVKSTGKDRGQLIAHYARMFDSEPALQKCCGSQTSFVNGSMMADGMAALTPSERRALR